MHEFYDPHRQSHGLDDAGSMAWTIDGAVPEAWAIEQCRACEHFLNAPGKIRTCDLSLRRRALYPLSYGRGRPILLGWRGTSATPEPAMETLWKLSCGSGASARRRLRACGILAGRCPRSPRPPTWLSFRARCLRGRNKRDFDAIASFYAPDAVWDMSAMGMGDVRGSWRRSGASSKTGWVLMRTIEIEPEEILDLGNGVMFCVVVQQGRPVGSGGTRRSCATEPRDLGGWQDRAASRSTPTSTRPVLPPNASPRNGGRRCRRRTWSRPARDSCVQPA